MNVFDNPVEEKDLKYIKKKAEKELKILSGKKILLVGAGGFLGYYFIKSILSQNDDNPNGKIYLTALSTFSKGVPKWLIDLAKVSDLKILKKDITKFKIPESEHFDYIIHAASIASPTYYREHPIETINSNVKGLYNILEYMRVRKSKSKKVLGLLFFSTSEIYGDPTPGNIPTPETYRGNVSCTGPRACYDESKRFCETLCVNYSKVYDLPIRVARPFNNYGPGLKVSDKRVIPDLAKSILNEEDIILFSDGSPSRTFCYVADAIVGYFKIITKGRDAEAYNIGVEGPEVSIRELTEKLRKIAQKEFGYKGSVRFKKSPDKEYLTDNPQRRRPSIDKAKSELGYSPLISLEEGLTRSLLWYKSTSK